MVHPYRQPAEDLHRADVRGAVPKRNRFKAECGNLQGEAKAELQLVPREGVQAGVATKPLPWRLSKCKRQSQVDMKRGTALACRDQSR